MHIIPRPRSVAPGEGTCAISAGFSPAGDTTGLETDLERLHHAGPVPLRLKQRMPASPRKGPGSDSLAGDDPTGAPRLEEQAYTLRITTSAVEIFAGGLPGLRHGLATLRQLIRQYPQQLPCCTIEDGPEILHRGVMLDVSRGKVPRRGTVLALIDRLQEWKYNVLQLYWEDTYRLPGHPLIGHLAGAYTREETAYLDRYCRDRGIELQPNLQTFSHMHGILRLPGYQHLAESKSLFTLAPGKEETYALLRDIFQEVLPWFTSRTLNINMDEAYDLGTGYSATAVEQEGAEAVFLKHIRRVCALAREAGAERILLWADCLNQYPALHDTLSGEVVWVDWNYNPMEQYPSLDNVAGKNRPFWIAPGTSSWNALFPRTENSRINIHGFTREARERGAEGVLVTHWGDYGHHQPLSFSYYGFLFAADQAWTGGRPEEDHTANNPDEHDAFEAAASVLFFSSSQQEKAFRLLEQTNNLPGLQVGFKTQTIYALFDDLLTGLTLKGNDKYPAIPRETFEGLADLGGRAAAVLEPDADTGRVSDMVRRDQSEIFSRELYLSARLIKLVGRRGLLSLEIIAAFGAAEVTTRVTEDLILRWILTLKELYRDHSRLREDFVRLWELEALPEGREGALYLFDKGSTRYGEAAAWLAGQREAILSGGTVDTTLKTYRAGDTYSTLWTDNTLNLWDRAYPWR
ncbi:MAG: hypothetical protein EA427_00415 [Spirochaetaceae bacterium]|nr:MAG: hypothetical protein EA427_00415 [Spirochaetaceae bacterium]